MRLGKSDRRLMEIEIQPYVSNSKTLSYFRDKCRNQSNGMDMNTSTSVDLIK